MERRTSQHPMAARLGLALVACSVLACSRESGRRDRIEVTSTVDGTSQPSYLLFPSASAPTTPVPLAVLFHTWSYDLDQRHRTVEREAARLGWLLLVPNFRGRNDHPEACGSTVAQQDVLDAVQWVRNRFPVDSSRIYALGLSGGGHMTMLMVSRAPELWAAATAWVGIGDLAAYHQEHATDGDGEMTRQCLGGPPEQSDPIAADYRVRSPVTRLAQATAVPLDIAAGRFDPEVAFTQSIGAFNVLARARGVPTISPAEIVQLRDSGSGLLNPSPSDTATDPAFGRRIFLRRWAGPSRLTIFDGSHEWLPVAAVAWLAEHRKP